jgi:NaMN:DMB phosphoribosyltransferase
MPATCPAHPRDLILTGLTAMLTFQLTLLRGVYEENLVRKAMALYQAARHVSLGNLL